MSWNAEMSYAYTVGVADGKAGFRRGRPNDFEGCYEQGWQHGKRSRVAEILSAWDKARDEMRDYLMTNVGILGGARK